MGVPVSSGKEFFSLPAIQIRERRVRAAARMEGDATIRRRRAALQRVDRELEKGNYKVALKLVKQLRAHPAGLLRGFDAAAPEVLRNGSSLEELRLTGTEWSSVQLAVDAIIFTIQQCLEFHEEEAKVSVQDLDAENYNSIHEDHLMCMQHEAGHFLVGYMLGVLPRRYKVPTVNDLLQDKFAGGKVEFIGFEFLRDVDEVYMSSKISKGKLGNETLRKFLCVILGGLAAEHLSFGYSELLHSDVQKLDRVLKWVGFPDTKINSETRKGAEAAVLILSRHNEVCSKLAEAMALGRSVGFCIETIERALK